MAINDLIRKLILGEISLSQGLMLAKVTFKGALSKESYAWICNELDHYEDAASMPEYRIVDCDIKVLVNVPYYGTRIEELDTSVINRHLEGNDKPYASPNKMLIRQGIESIEQSLPQAGHTVDMEMLQGQVDLLMRYYTIPPGCRILKMYQECRVEQIQNIIPCVRNKLISILEGVTSTLEGTPLEETTKQKRVFISYGWDDDEHRSWVHSLASGLSADFNVMIDEKQPLGADLNAFMEQLVTKADRVLLILTPKYKVKADNRQNGVGYESVLISSQLYQNQGTSKFIPIIRKGDVKECYPLYLGNRKGLDMRNDSCYEEQLRLLIEDLKKY